MRGDSAERAAQAGTVESMDCLVTITAAQGERAVEISGNSAGRFRTAMERCVLKTLDALGAPAVRVSVQDNGAADVVLGARVEAAYRRFEGGCAK